MASGEKREGTKTERMFDLLMRISGARAPIPMSEFDNPKWGHKKTLKRLLEELNDKWSSSNGGLLFEITDEEGQNVQRGERFIRKIGPKIESSRAETIAILPAFFELLRLLKGTIFDHEFKIIFDKLAATLGKKERESLTRMSSKFYYFGKGMKHYEDKSDILDEVYDALMRERLLKVTKLKEGKPVEYTLRPLTLMMYNNGLYLVALRDDKNEDADPYHWSIDSFETAKSLKKTKFNYPTNYNPKKIYDGQFGIIHGGNESQIDVALEFEGDLSIKRYLKERKWTSSDSFEEKSDGKLILKMRVSDLTEVKSFILSFGEQVRVIAPKELQQQITETIKKLSKVYRRIV